MACLGLPDVGLQPALDMGHFLVGFLDRLGRRGERRSLDGTMGLLQRLSEGGGPSARGTSYMRTFRVQTFGFDIVNGCDFLKCTDLTQSSLANPSAASMHFAPDGKTTNLR